MKYTVNIRASAEKELDALSPKIRDSIVAKILVMENEPRPFGAKKLKGKNAYRLRIGDYRVIYTLSEKAKEIVIESVGHRRDIYR